MGRRRPLLAVLAVGVLAAIGFELSPASAGASPPEAAVAADAATSTTTGTVITCQPVAMGGPGATTSTSLTWALPFSPCVVGDTFTATAYASQAEAVAGTNPVSSATVGLPASAITVSGLSAATDYWVRFTNPYGVQGPVRTAANPATTTTDAPPSSCTATWRTLSAWPGGFLGEVTVANTSAAVSTSWRLSWTWEGSARISHAYNAILGGTATSPALTSLGWNAALPPGTSTTMQVLGTVSGSLVTPTIGCLLSQ